MGWKAKAGVAGRVLLFKFAAVMILGAPPVFPKPRIS
jgi:hypothetical protein